MRPLSIISVLDDDYILYIRPAVQYNFLQSLWYYKFISSCRVYNSREHLSFKSTWASPRTSFKDLIIMCAYHNISSIHLPTFILTRVYIALNTLLLFPHPSFSMTPDTCAIFTYNGRHCQLIPFRSHLFLNKFLLRLSGAINIITGVYLSRKNHSNGMSVAGSCPPSAIIPRIVLHTSMRHT